jgi:hypothetical protein
MQSVHITTNVVSSNPLRRGVLDTTLIFNNIFLYPPAIAVGDIEIATVRLSAVTLSCLCDNLVNMDGSTNVVSSNPLRRGVLDTTLCDKVCQ